ncbi:MAG: hypothetical protein RhofKO_37620 [Rhodothermales bacterium]
MGYASLPDEESSAPPETSALDHKDWLRRGELRWFAAELIIIIVGVLIALAVNAWWADRDAHVRERIVLADLHRDFVVNQAEIAEVQASLQAHHRHFTRLEQLDATAIRALSADSANLFYLSLLGPVTFDPIRGSVDALVASGDLGLIRNATLRGDLTSFLGLVDDTQEERDMLMQTVLLSADYMTAYGGPWGTPNSPTTLTPPDLIRLREDPVAMGKARLARLAGLEYMGELEQIIPVIDSILMRTRPTP